MRHWARLLTLLFGLAGTGYVRAARPRTPVAIERPLGADSISRRTTLTPDWWRP